MRTGAAQWRRMKSTTTGACSKNVLSAVQAVCCLQTNQFCNQDKREGSGMLHVYQQLSNKSIKNSDTNLTSTTHGARWVWKLQFFSGSKKQSTMQTSRLTRIQSLQVLLRHFHAFTEKVHDVTVHRKCRYCQNLTSSVNWTRINH